MAAPLTVRDLAPLRRMLGSHSLVVRVSADGDLAPFEIMPELFLGRSIRQLLTGAVREEFETACRRVIADRAATVFEPADVPGDHRVVITPVFDDDGDDGPCRFLVCWARRDLDAASPASNVPLQWADLHLDDVAIRYRAIDRHEIEAAAWWHANDGALALAGHHEQVASVGLASSVAALTATAGIEALTEDDETTLRLSVGGAEVFDGLLPIMHGALRGAGVDPKRVTLGVPVEVAVDADLLPIIVHLRTLGLQIDIVGLDALTATLHTVSDTSTHTHTMPATTIVEAGDWSDDPSTARRDAAIR